jgi:hypothetical protein
MTDDRRDETGEDVLNRILAVNPLPLKEEPTEDAAPPSARVSDGNGEKQERFENDSEEEEEEVPAADKNLPFFRKNNPVLWVGVLIVVIFGGVLAALLLAPRADPYPDTVDFDDGRTFTLDLAPEDEAQNAAVQYLLEYARDKTTLNVACYTSFEVTEMDTYPFEAAWADYTGNTIYSSSLTPTTDTEDEVSYDTVVLVSAQATCDEVLLQPLYNNYWDGYHMFYVFLAQGEDGSYTVDHMYLEPDGDEAPLLTREWDAGGKSYTMSVYGTGETLTYIMADGVTQEGDLNGSEDDPEAGDDSDGSEDEVSAIRYTSRVFLSDGETDQLLFLAESDKVYYGGHSTQDINGDGEPDLTLTLGSEPVVFLYDGESGGYVENETLSWTYLELNSLFTGSLLYYPHLGETAVAVAYLSYFETPTQLTELARMETDYSQEDNVQYSFYIDGELVREITLGFDDGTEYGVSAVWKEIMLRAVLNHGLATLPTEGTHGSEAGVQWLGQVDDVTFYSVSEALLMVAEDDVWTVLPVYSGNTVPFYGDFDGDGEKEIVSGYWGQDPSVIRKTEHGWDVTTLCDVYDIYIDVNSSLKFSWEERADDYLLHVTYGKLSASIPMAEKGSVSFFVESYYTDLSMGADGTFLFPITVYLNVTGKSDVAGVTGTLLFSVDMDGETEAVSLVLEESDSY